MVNRMKTTVEIADPLLAAAKRVAAARGTTVRALVEAGLRRVLEEQGHNTPFRLRDVSFEGDGLTAEFAEGGWQRVRDAIYEGHGA
jgi:Arc/MetJ family transcription regulator